MVLGAAILVAIQAVILEAIPVAIQMAILEVVEEEEEEVATQATLTQVEEQPVVIPQELAIKEVDTFRDTQPVDPQVLASSCEGSFGRMRLHQICCCPALRSVLVAQPRQMHGEKKKHGT